MEFYWRKSTQLNLSDMRIVINEEEILSLLHREGGDSKPTCDFFLMRLQYEFSRTNSHKCKIILRITKGPTYAAVDFHCILPRQSDMIQIALNSTEEYSGGRLCYYVNEKLYVLDERPMCSIVMHPSLVLHGVTSLDKGTMYSLLLVSQSYGDEDPKLFQVQKNDIELF